MLQIPKHDWNSVSALYISGQSMRAIAETLSVPLGAVTYVLRKTNTKRRDAKASSALSFAQKKPSFAVCRPKSQRDKTLEAMGTMLYWAEGYKTKNASGIDFTNSDPNMVFIFMHFLRKRYTLDNKRLRVLLYCYSNQNKRALITYWSRLLEIPINQFSKPYVREKNTQVSTKLMKYGVVHIRYHDKKMLIDILNLIHSYTQDFCVDTQVVNEDAL